ncbi:hypothetical protein LCGC14_0973020 [marine sediment metagenome]|uniref:Phosphotyrosine protein phosphatase I domain-containing protein n=1 Tax=marine sediment metagenome TaxID=412755 RepID=A0A0F9NX69_9ZZZZ
MDELREQAQQKILFVCTGNLCRSPMAEALFNVIAKKKGLPFWSSSAGIMAYEGNKASENAILAMSERGIDLTYHRARLVEEELLDEFDIIFAMEQSHLDSLPKSHRDKAHLLSDFASDVSEDVFDPYGADLETYEVCAELIEKHLLNLPSRLLQESKSL